EEKHGVLPALGAERDHEGLAALVGIARPCLLFSVDHEAAAGGARRLDGALDDDVQEREGIVGRGERLPEAVDRVLDAAALGSELPGHLVEGAPESRELVAPP